MVLRVSGGTCELIYLVITIRAECAIAKPATIMTTVSSMVRGAIGVPNTSMVPGIPNHDEVTFSADKLVMYATMYYIGFSRRFTNDGF